MENIQELLDRKEEIIKELNYLRKYRSWCGEDKEEYQKYLQCQSLLQELEEIANQLELQTV